MQPVRVRSCGRLLVSALLCCLLPQIAVGQQSGERQTAPAALAVIAYVYGDTSNIERFALEQLTHVIYSFARLDGSRLAVTAEQVGDLARLTRARGAHPQLKVLLAFGGWGGCESCSDVFSEPQARQAFARSARELLERYDLDGLDLDWEYPAVAGYPGHRYKPADRDNFTQLVKTLRETLDARHELSFAAGGTREILERSIDWRGVMPHVDRVNVMSYDLYNGNSVTSGHHTPLLSSAAQADSVDNAVRFLLSSGVERRKLVIGAAAYARVWQLDEATDSPLYRPAVFRETVNYRDFDTYFDAGFSDHWDEGAQAPYRFDASRRLFASYDDPRSITLKTHYAIATGLGGIMFWQLAGDRFDGGLLQAVHRARQAAAEHPPVRPVD